MDLRHFAEELQEEIDGRNVSQGKRDILQVIVCVAQKNRGEQQEGDCQYPGTVPGQFSGQQPGKEYRQRTRQGIDDMSRQIGFPESEEPVDPVAEIINGLPVILEECDGRIYCRIILSVGGKVLVNMGCLLVMNGFVAGYTGIQTQKRAKGKGEKAEVKEEAFRAEERSKGGLDLFHGTGLFVEFPDEIERPVLAFLIDAINVLTDDPHEGELDGTEKIDAEQSG